MASIDINSVTKQMEIWYTSINNTVSVFYAIIGLILALAGFNLYFMKKGIKKAIEKESERIISRLLESVSKPSYLDGLELLDSTKLKGKTYEFPVLKGVSFKNDLWNKVILHPIKGNKKLDYQCWVNDGMLYIEFKNYNYKEDKGVYWTIIYYPEMIEHLYQPKRSN